MSDETNNRADLAEVCAEAAEQALHDAGSRLAAVIGKIWHEDPEALLSEATRLTVENAVLSARLKAAEDKVWLLEEAAKGRRS